ncbi:HTTM domain-containing protein [Streptomyces sp. N2-109]|uniref:HTTM domain-containing protein n=1 Tax=Streptomyces gossypii TaxID=2883101 RepID=A0ABT2JX44_9ACTN|nr:HTTM domain-containing protein [Streptomyces gossypii]MCT2592411.1 HTTM domain-containing protein [Streptomyces gossypii]
MTMRAVLRLGGGAVDRLDTQLRRHLRQVTLQPFALYSAAVVRIGLAGLFLLFLLRELPHADRLWGPGSPFTPALLQETVQANGWDGFLGWWFTFLATDEPLVFWTLYVTAIVVSALYLLGWHTRALAFVFCFFVVAFYMRGFLANSGWAMLSMLFANYLVFCASGRRWSLDARRRARREREASGGRMSPAGISETEELRRRLVTVLHNAGMAVIAFQVMVVYGSAAMYKIQGETWREGTALYYALLSDDFSTWPELSSWFAGHGTLMAVLAYVTVFSQVLFPALVFNRRLKYCVVVVMMGTHLGIGVLMALPMFSAVSIVGDLVLLPDTFWLRAAALVRLLRAPPPTAARVE